ncbi:acyltransferase [Enterobacter wuhouensis]|uniref:acyltransferase family protein n=1 Tax=Enterobacter wuhouensis TaxID=2529381 RepID=UPI002FDCE40A
MSTLNFNHTVKLETEADQQHVKVNHKILSIQYLRGIAAILIILFHSTALIGPDWKSIVRNGMVGVDVFFIMSGFIIYYITTNKSEITPRKFFTKRFFRIFPPFIFVWFIVSCVSYQNTPFIEVIKSLLLFHTDYNSSAPAFQFNLIGPAWTLTYEIYFYAIFCFAGFVTYKYRGLTSSLMLIFIPILLQLYFNGSFSYQANIKANFHLTSILQAPLKILSNAMLWEFTGGIALAFLFLKYRKGLNRINYSIRAVTSIILLTIFIQQIFFANVHPQGIGGLFWPSLALVTSALIAEDLFSFEVKSLSFLGDISYSLYLSHWSIIKIFVTFYPTSWNNSHGVAGLVAFIAICILVSYIMYVAIEKPSIRLARKLLS